MSILLQYQDAINIRRLEDLANPYEKKRVFLKGNFNLKDFKPSPKVTSTHVGYLNSEWIPRKIADKFSWKGLNYSPIRSQIPKYQPDKQKFSYQIPNPL